MTKTALITGITGQDGAYLAELLLDKGYMVHGIKRRAVARSTPTASTTSTRTRTSADVRFFMHYGDLTDATNLIRIVQETQPDEIYNLAAQSHVQVSFETPEYTANADALGTLRLLEAIRILGLREDGALLPGVDQSRCSAWCSETPQTRDDAASTRAAPTAPPRSTRYWITVNYREAYGMYASQRHPVQPREPDPRRDLRDAQDHARRGAHRPGAAGRAVPRQPGLAARLGPRARLRARACSSCCSRTSPTTTSSPPASSTRVREFAQRAFAEVGVTLRFEGEGRTRSASSTPSTSSA